MVLAAEFCYYWIFEADAMRQPTSEITCHGLYTAAASNERVGISNIVPVFITYTIQVIKCFA